MQSSQLAAPPAHCAAPGWCVVLPVKGGPGAKSRLGGGPRLATAIAQDCLQAVLACPSVHTVLVVSADPQTRRWAAVAGATVVTESVPGSGLPSAVHDGLQAARDVRAGGPTAVLLGDLPALRPGDLADALAAAWRVLTGPSRRCPPRMAFVPDADGSGTVLLAAAATEAMDPAFGTGSAAEHVRRGADRLELPLPRLRRDVDVLADLEAALALGCGSKTTALLDAGTVPVVPSDDLGAARRDPRDGRIA